MATDDDRPRPPPLEDVLCANKPFIGDPDIRSEALDEGAAVATADRQVACAPEHCSGNHSEVGERIRDGTGRRQVTAISNRGVARRRQRYAELLQEDDHEQAARLVLQHEYPDHMGEWPPPTRFLQPAWKIAREREG